MQNFRKDRAKSDALNLLVVNFSKQANAISCIRGENRQNAILRLWEEDMKSRTKFFWIYSIALFSIAFILIGFSAFTGVRYQEKQTEARELYQGAQASVLGLQERLEQLEQENKQLKLQVSELKNEVAELKETDQKADLFEALVKIQNLINNKKASEAKIIFEAIDTSLLSGEAQTLYEELKAKLF